MSVHEGLARRKSRGKKPRQAIKLRRLNPGRPHIRVLIAQKHMALVIINRPHKRSLAEIRPGEAEVERLGGKKGVVLEAVAPGGGGVDEVAVGVGDGDGGGGGEVGVYVWEGRVCCAHFCALIDRIRERRGVCVCVCSGVEERSVAWPPRCLRHLCQGLLSWTYFMLS